MPEEPTRVLVLGRWARAVTEELGRHLTLVPGTTAAGSSHEHPVPDWVLVRVAPDQPPGPGPGATVSPVFRISVARRMPPGARLAVIDPAGRWDLPEACDVYLGGGDVRPGELLAALSMAGRGFRLQGVAAWPQPYLPYDSTWAAPTRPANSAHPAHLDDEATARLTERERELLEALCAGLGNAQIAQKLQISRSTVEFHLTKIFRKLGVSSRAEAIVRVMRPDQSLPL